MALPSGRSATSPVTAMQYSLRRLWAHGLVADHHLGDAAGLAQVEEGHPAVVAATRHPAGEGDGLSGVGRGQRAGVVGADHESCSFRATTRATRSSRGTASCSPVFMSFSWATPASRSRSPSTTTYGAPERSADFIALFKLRSP